MSQAPYALGGEEGEALWFFGTLLLLKATIGAFFADPEFNGIVAAVRSQPLSHPRRRDIGTDARAARPRIAGAVGVQVVLCRV